MSRLRLLMCQVDDADDQMTELARVALPPPSGDEGAAPLDTREIQVASLGQRVLGRLCALQWDVIDAQAVARYRARQAPGCVGAEGCETLLVASRFGTLVLRRQVVAHRDGRPHIMPGNDVLPDHQGLPCATAARLVGWQIGEVKVLSATLRTLVRVHGARIRCLEQGEATFLLSTGTCGQRLRGVPIERRPPGPGQCHALRTSCLLTSEGRRYLSGRGAPFLRQVRAAVQACCARSLLVVADGAGWIRTFFRDHLAAYPQAELLLDWDHLAKKCRDLLAQVCPERDRRRMLVRRLLRTLWAGNVPRALRLLTAQQGQAADPAAVATLCTHLEARAEWIPSYRIW